MASSLQLLFAEIDRVPSTGDLRSKIVPKIGQHFDTTRSGIFFFDQITTLQPPLQKIFKLALSIEHNPVARYLVEHHAPVHEGLVTSPPAWKMICPRPDHWHVLVGPIVYQGQLVGAVGCTRQQSQPAFNHQDLNDLSGICLHLSIWAAALPSAPRTLPIAKLTDREWQIVELVALGKTNAEIGRELWITENSVKQALKRMFRKLAVASRAEMVAQLSRTPRD